MKYVLTIVIVLIVAGGGVAWWYTRDKAAEAAAEANAVQTAKVERQNLRVAVDATGAVSSNQDVDIKCMASGQIIEMPYTDVSAEVKPGALLVRVDPKLEIQSLQSAKAVVASDKAHIAEAQINLEIAKQSLVTTQMRDEAALMSAEAQAADAHAKADRTLELFNNKLDSKEDLETAQTTAAQADAAVKTAKAAIEELKQDALQIDTKKQEIEEMNAQLEQDNAKVETAQQNLDYCTVTAPDVDPSRANDPPQWYISAMGVNVNIGYLVQSGSSGFSSGTTVMTLSDMSHVYILATVDESDIGTLLTRFTAGQELPVVLTADAYKNVEFRGKVVRIATKGVNTSNVVTFEVKIEVTSPNRALLRPIMTTNVEIITGERDDALTVPAQAVSFEQPDATTESAGTQTATSGPPANDPPADAPKADKKAGKQKHKKQRPADDGLGTQDKPLPAFVDVMKPDGTTETRSVMVGLTDGTSYEIVSGLQEGDTVVLKKIGANSRWRGGRGGANGMMRAIH